MVSPHSGFRDEVVNLVEIDTELFTLYIQGKPYHPTVNALHLHRSDEGDFVDANLLIQSHSSKLKDIKIQVYSPRSNTLVPYLTEPMVPLFFETQIYTLNIHNKSKHILGFDHVNPQIRNSVKSYKNLFLMGSISFGNEVGLTDLHFTIDGNPVLTLTLEIFPSKIDYKSDYEMILRDVNEQIYNLSFDFMRKTYQMAGIQDTRCQSLTEFFSIIKKLFDKLVAAVERINDAPHHKLERKYEVKDASLVRQAGKANLHFLSRNPHYLIPDPKGNLRVNGNTYQPSRLIETKRSISFDTAENRFLKWVLERIDYKLKHLVGLYQSSARKKNQSLSSGINGMRNHIRRMLQLDFIREAGPLQQISISLVLQMAPGYRDAYKIYLMLLKGLSLHGDLFQISLKDVAQLYEYWCFLKINHLLRKKYHLKSQDVIKVKQSGLFVTLDRSRSARIEYENPSTGETFELFYNNVTAPAKDFPTIPQRPDNVLTIKKSDSQVIYKYVFDAKYRMDPAYPGTPYREIYGRPGPLEEDINTMHRYRDAIVYQERGKVSYERAMFGAYVLFPYHDEKSFVEHRFYKSIELMNIGAFPFLPNATGLLEKFLDELIMDSPEKAFHRAIQQVGTDEFYHEINLEKDSLVIPVKGKNELNQYKHSGIITIPLSVLKKHKFLFGIKRIAFFQVPEHFLLNERGIHKYGLVQDWSIIPSNVGQDDLVVQFNIERWIRLDQPISPGVSSIQECLVTSSYLLDRASFIEELRLEQEADIVLWRELRRKGLLKVELDHKMVDLASRVVNIALRKSRTNLLGGCHGIG